jgi:hypothetical protein
MVPDIVPQKELLSRAGHDTDPTMRAGRTRAQSKNATSERTTQEETEMGSTTSPESGSARMEKANVDITFDKLYVMSQAYAKEAIQNTKYMDMKDKVLAAYEKVETVEYVSLTQTHGILVRLTENDSDYIEAKQTACPARAACPTNCQSNEMTQQKQGLCLGGIYKTLQLILQGLPTTQKLYQGHRFELHSHIA